MEEKKTATVETVETTPTPTVTIKEVFLALVKNMSTENNNANRFSIAMEKMVATGDLLVAKTDFSQKSVKSDTLKAELSAYLSTEDGKTYCVTTLSLYPIQVTKRCDKKYFAACQAVPDGYKVVAVQTENATIKCYQIIDENGNIVAACSVEAENIGTAQQAKWQFITEYSFMDDVTGKEAEAVAENATVEAAAEAEATEEEAPEEVHDVEIVEDIEIDDDDEDEDDDDDEDDEDDEVEKKPTSLERLKALAHMADEYEVIDDEPKIDLSDKKIKSKAMKSYKRIRKEYDKLQKIDADFEKEEKHKKRIKTLKICGWVIGGVAVAAGIGYLVYRVFIKKC